MASLWATRLAEHQLPPTLAEIDELLADDAFSASIETVEYTQRIRNVVTVVRTALVAIDPELVPVGTLDALFSSAAPLADELRAFVSSSDASRLAAADTHADNLLANAAQIRVATSAPNAVANVQESVTSFRRSAGQLAARLEQEAAALRAEIQRLTEQVQKRTAESEQEKARLDQAISTHQQQFSDAEARSALRLSSSRSPMDAPHSTLLPRRPAHS